MKCFNCNQENNISKTYQNLCVKCSYSASLNVYIIKFGEVIGNEKYELACSNRSSGIKGFYNNLSATERKQHIENITKNMKIACSKLNHSEIIKKCNDKRKQNPQLNNTRIEHYLSKGLSKDDAETALKNRQEQTSLNSFIKKYGADEGLKRFKLRRESQITTNKQTFSKMKLDKNRYNKFCERMSEVGSASMMRGKFEHIKIPLLQIKDIMDDIFISKRDEHLNKLIGVNND